MFIGEVSRRTGVSVRMLRHYESLGLLSPAARTSAGYREYGDGDLRRILHVESLRSLGMSLQEVGGALDDPDFAPEELIAELITRTRQRLGQERELLARLRAVASSTPADWEDVVGVIELLHRLRSPNPGERQQAVLASGGSPAAALAAAALREDDPNVAGALRWAVLQAGEEAVTAATRGLAATDVRVRRRAMRILTEAGEPHHLPALRQALSDGDATVRALAALALGRHGETGAAPVLLDMVLVGDRDVDAAEALGRLARLKRETRAEILRAVLRALDSTDTPPPARLRLAQALAEFPGGDAEAALAGLRDDAQQAVRLTATAVLRQRGKG